MGEQQENGAINKSVTTVWTGSVKLGNAGRWFRTLGSKLSVCQLFPSLGCCCCWGHYVFCTSGQIYTKPNHAPRLGKKNAQVEMQRCLWETRQRLTQKVMWLLCVFSSVGGVCLCVFRSVYLLFIFYSLLHFHCLYFLNWVQSRKSFKKSFVSSRCVWVQLLNQQTEGASF